jgi:hypothetical protein
MAGCPKLNLFVVCENTVLVPHNNLQIFLILSTSFGPGKTMPLPPAHHHMSVTEELHPTVV